MALGAQKNDLFCSNCNFTKNKIAFQKKTVGFSLIYVKLSRKRLLINVIACFRRNEAFLILYYDGFAYSKTYDRYSDNEELIWYEFNGTHTLIV